MSNGMITNERAEYILKYFVQESGASLREVQRIYGKMEKYGVTFDELFEAKNVQREVEIADGTLKEKIEKYQALYGLGKFIKDSNAVQKPKAKCPECNAFLFFQELDYFEELEAYDSHWTCRKCGYGRYNPPGTVT